MVSQTRKVFAEYINPLFLRFAEVFRQPQTPLVGLMIAELRGADGGRAKDRARR
jgi:hypothetical protein